VGNLLSLIERDAEEGRQRLVFGLVTATVAAINDDGTYELNYLSMGDDGPSTPARAMMPMAGNRRGMYCLPEPGDEVVVGFELGNTCLPIILGAVWNDNDPPPDQADPSPHNDIRTIVSRSGHEITFDDTPGAEKITIRTCGGHVMELNESVEADPGETFKPPGIRLQTVGGAAIELSDATGTLTVRAPAAIRLEGPVVAIQADAAVTMEAPMISLVTTNIVTASAVLIDGKPFGAHLHTPPVVPGSPPTTGPVAP
jgi:phage baseplate assembly protein gpV